jgi:hypothetical protein
MSNRASYQHIPNIVLGQSKPKSIPKKKLVKGAEYPSSLLSPPLLVRPKPIRAKLSLKY